MADEHSPDLDLPAWSEAFHGDGPGPAPNIGLDHPITRDWAYGDGVGSGVRVAVVDCGVDGTHPLVGGVSEYVDVVRDTDADEGIRFDVGDHEDLYGHGTACAAIIRSLAPAVELVSVRVLGADLKGSAFNFAHGLDWCLEHDVRIANLSMSTSNEKYAETFHEIVDDATFARMMVVSAMNNERKRTIPSEYAGVFSVACAPGTDREQVLYNPKGPAEWAAAGIDVEIAWNAHGSITATGNSFAAPVIAGHLARILGTHPELTVWQARTVLAAISTNAAGQ